MNIRFAFFRISVLRYPQGKYLYDSHRIVLNVRGISEQLFICDSCLSLLIFHFYRACYRNNRHYMYFRLNGLFDKYGSANQRSLTSAIRNTLSSFGRISRLRVSSILVCLLHSLVIQKSIFVRGDCILF